MILSTVTAVTAIANIVKSSLGPVGLDKMLVDDIGVSFVAIGVFFSSAEFSGFFKNQLVLKSKRILSKLKAV